MSKKTSLDDAFPTLQVGDVVCMGSLLEGVTKETMDWQVTERSDTEVTFAVSFLGVSVGSMICSKTKSGLKWRKV